MPSDRAPVGLLPFFLRWADKQRWKVPALHARILSWLEGERAPVRVVLVFRGAGKSTLYGVAKAHALRSDPESVHQVWAADDKLARKMSRYTRHVLLTHPWCGGLLDPRAPESGFFVDGAADLRNPSMQANSILGNATGSRATDIDFDDIEVPKNIRSPELRERLRERIDEATHILVPDGRKTFIGTPHTYDSIYSEMIEGGAAVLKIPLFEHVKRYETTDQARRYRFDFEPGADGLYVITGIGKFARVLEAGRDYSVQGDEVVFAAPPCAVLDICAGNAWPERFHRRDIEVRRKGCRTLNSWDSQYLLEAKPLRESRLDPDRMIPYEVEPVLRTANRRPVLMLGRVQLLGFKCWWDVSLGKVKSDASALCIVFTDEIGRLYWHRAIELTGDLEEVRDGELVGGQCHQLIRELLACHVHHVTVETNGPGGFVPPILRKWAARHGITVSEEYATTNKQARILDAYEPPLSAQFLWAHTSVLDGPAYAQMKHFDPSLRDQPDDYLDAGAGAIRATPVRIGKVVGTPRDAPMHDWSPVSGSFEVEVEFDAP